MIRFASRALLVAVAVPCAALIAAQSSHLGDYALSMHIGDNPAPTIQALLHGQLSAAAHAQPVMGLFSILVRLPFAALASVFQGGELLTYRLGILPCAFALGLLGGWLVLAARGRGRSLLGAAAVAALLLFNPLIFSALWWGHPEELLAGALCVGAVLASIQGRPVLAGALLGCALGTKEWALLAVVPTLLGARQDRWRTLLIAGGVAAPLALALPFADPTAFLRSAREVGSWRVTGFTTWWWPITATHTATVYVDGSVVTATVHTLPLGFTRAEIAWLSPLLALPLGWVYQRRSATADPVHVLGVLALLFLLRAALDPVANAYYYVPFVIALIAWELMTTRGLLVVSPLAIVGLWWLVDRNALVPEARVAAFVLLTVGLAGYLVARTIVGASRPSVAPLPSAPSFGVA